MTQHDMVAVEELVREIARALVDEPGAVEVEAVGRDENTVLKLRVAPQDVGKVIGKQGRTARSVRTILGAVSMKLHHRYTLDILEEDDEASLCRVSWGRIIRSHFSGAVNDRGGTMGVARADSSNPGAQGRGLRRYSHRFSRKIFAA